LNADNFRIRVPADDGVYIFDATNGGWVRVREAPFLPVEGVYLYYFRNRVCPGCRAFDRVWVEVLKQLRGVTPVVVQCESFFYRCGDEAASYTFLLFLVDATPQIVAVVVRNGVLIYAEREYGVVDVSRIRELVERAVDIYSGRAEPQPLADEGQDEEGAYIVVEEIRRDNARKVAEEIKRLILEGRSIREICDESGCRFYIDEQHN